jgi:D-alanine-D-alanine ligase
VSARSVIDALDPERYEVEPVGIAKDGSWHRVPGGPPAIRARSRRLPEVQAGGGNDVSLAQTPGERRLVGGDGSTTDIDVVIPLLHGPYGEDGTIQGFLELAGVPYVGAGVLGSALGMDKALQKTILEAAGLPVVSNATVYERDWRDDPESTEAAAAELGFPLFAKPANLGSSVGISKVHDASELSPALDEAFRYDTKAVLEAAFENAREIECAVLGNDDPVASLPGEVVPSGEFYDYRAKYVDESSTLIIPAKLPEAVIVEIQRMAVAAFRAIDCAGMARVDFFYRDEPEPRLVVNELNTIPGFTSISMYPKMWEASGVSYAELLDRLIDLAIERFERDRKKGTTLPE